VNRTTGRPQAGVAVGYFQVGNGLELVAQATTDAQGRFSIDQTPQTLGALRATVDGVTYTLMLQPGAPTGGLTLDVYDASSAPGASKITKHMLLFQPAGGLLTVNETCLLSNAGNTSWNDSRNGTLRVYLPSAVQGKARVNATAPGGMPIEAPLVKTAQANVYGVDFAVKPGETRIDLEYAVPYTEGAPYQGKIVTRDENTYLIAPHGVALTGAGLKDLGIEPQTQSHVYGLAGTAYSIRLTGTPLVAAGGSDAENADSGPQIEVVDPRALGQAELILPLALGILALGFVILYRAGAGTPAAKETHGRGRR
jgi:hypothetical protein